MRKWIILSLTFCVFALTSCIEIIDDITLNADGTGSFKYSINLSSSKIKINSLLALDSLDGKAIPSKEEIKLKVSEFKSRLALQEGIKNVILEEDYTTFMFKLQCDFDNVNDLQNGIKKAINDVVKHPKNEMDEFQWVAWTGNTLARSIPQATVEQAKRLKTEELELLKQGTYTSITRFEKEVVKFDNESAILAKNKKAVMLKSNTYLLMKNVDLLKNKIYLAD